MYIFEEVVNSFTEVFKIVRNAIDDFYFVDSEFEGFLARKK